LDNQWAKILIILFLYDGHYEKKNAEELEDEQDCKHKKRSSCGTPLFIL